MKIKIREYYEGIKYDYYFECDSLKIKPTDNKKYIKVFYYGEQGELINSYTISTKFKLTYLGD